MKKHLKIITIIIILIAVIVSFYFFQKNRKIVTVQNLLTSSRTTTNTTAESTSTTTTTTPTSQLAKPVADFKTRITKKPFGIYITPKTSPVQPEKFSGYHNAVDVEHGDINSDVDVFAVYDGQIIYSGFINGYGGFVAISHDFEDEKIISIYGHLNPDNLTANNYEVKKGDKIGILGNAYSRQTDGERKHLHFAILKGENLDFRGYVPKESELSLWLNPLDFY